MEHKESYHHAVIFVKTIPFGEADSLVFGAYIDEVPYIQNDKYQGRGESFVFTLIPSIEKFSSKGKN